MPKAILNYTTSVEAAKTISEIMQLLQTHRARSILTNFDAQGQVESLSFQIEGPGGKLLPIRLPVDVDAIERVMRRYSAQNRIPPRYMNRAQAVRIAWRIVKDWVEAQLALLETEMVKLEQVFLPYVETPSGQTIYEMMVGRGFMQLPVGRGENSEGGQQ